MIYLANHIRTFFYQMGCLFVRHLLHIQYFLQLLQVGFCCFITHVGSLRESCNGLIYIPIKEIVYTTIIDVFGSLFVCLFHKLYGSSHIFLT